jgi:phage-related protein
MASEDIGSLVVRIEANMQNFIDGTNKFDKGLATMKKAAIGLGAVIGAGALFKSFIDDASEAENNLKQLETVIKSTGGIAGVTADQVTSMAAELQKVTKFSDDAIIAGDNLLLTFTNIGSDIFPQATEAMLNLSQALGQDVNSSAKMLGKALNDPIAGLTSLGRAGVQFSDSQKEMITAMVEAGDVAGAQKIILAELETQVGNSARAAGETFSGKLEILKNQFGEIKETIGGALLPVLSNLAGWFIEKMPEIQNFVSRAADVIGPILRKAFDIFNDNILPILKQLFSWVQENMPKIQSAIGYAFDSVRPLIEKVWKIIKDDIIPVFQQLYDWVKPYFPLIESIIKGAFDAVVLVANGVVDAIGLVVDAIKTVISWIDKFNNLQISEKAVKVTTSSAKAIYGKASGGSVLGNTPYIVGEKGPELFTPSSNGNITDASKTSQLLSGSSINYANMFNGATFYVRSDNDAKLIAKELYNLQKTSYRASGVTA